jgi:transcription-repair coupling factor (superfamily II helicase)
VIEELIDRYGPLPEPAELLIALARLRLLARAKGITEIGALSASTVRISPLTLPDSGQLRLKRLYAGAAYRATTSTVQVPIPRTGSGVSAPRIRDLELIRMVSGLLTELSS